MLKFINVTVVKMSQGIIDQKDHRGLTNLLKMAKHGSYSAMCPS